MRASLSSVSVHKMCSLQFPFEGIPGLQEKVVGWAQQVPKKKLGFSMQKNCVLCSKKVQFHGPLNKCFITWSNIQSSWALQIKWHISPVYHHCVSLWSFSQHGAHYCASKPRELEATYSRILRWSGMKWSSEMGAWLWWQWEPGCAFRWVVCLLSPPPDSWQELEFLGPRPALMLVEWSPGRVASTSVSLCRQQRSCTQAGWFLCIFWICLCGLNM